ncbi:MAG: hypothetical protein WC554_00915 [Clostridia bacterium]|jgi:hypothetical protein
MSVFNYKSKRDPLEGLRAEVARIRKCLKALKFWEVNDITFGDKVLRRRRVTPNPSCGTVAKGQWFDVNGLDRTEIGDGGGITDWSDWEFGFETPTTDVVAVNAGELQDSMLAYKAVAAANITVTGAGTFYIYVQYTYGSGYTPTIVGSETRPTMDALTYRRILHTWTLVNSVATLSKIGHIGNIMIPGTFGTV